MFKQYDTSGKTEFAASVAGRLLLIDPYNRQAISYIKEFALSKERFLSESREEGAPAVQTQTGPALSAFEEPGRKEKSQELFRECQKRIKEKSPGLENFKDIQKRFINAMTEESLGHYDESIRIFSDLIEAL
jgi:hypothetical protein